MTEKDRKDKIKKILSEAKPANKNSLQSNQEKPSFNNTTEINGKESLAHFGNGNIIIDRRKTVIINKDRPDTDPKKKHKPARTAAIACAFLIIPLTITIQSDTFKKNQNLFAPASFSSSVMELPDPASDISITPAALPTPSTPELAPPVTYYNNRCFSPGCSSRKYLIRRPVTDLNAKNELTSL